MPSNERESIPTAEERKQYEIKHPHIAPDLRDGITAQNVKTGFFPGEATTKGVYQVYNIRQSTQDWKICLAEKSTDRPELSNVLQALQETMYIA